MTRALEYRLIRRLTAISISVEIATGAALLLLPGLVVSLLLGVEAGGVEAVLARALGVALLSLGIGCWPLSAETKTASARAMLAYNGLISILLAYCGGLGEFAGPLLWPTVVLHAVVALLLLAGMVRANRHQLPG